MKTDFPFAWLFALLAMLATSMATARQVRKSRIDTIKN